MSENSVESETEPSRIMTEQRPSLSLKNSGEKPCGCGGSGSDMREKVPLSYIYAIGKVIHRFPNKSIELELAQATGRLESETKGRTNEQSVHAVLTDPDNRYIARQVCYLLTIEGVETYILLPRDPFDIEKLAQALRPAPDPGDVDVIIGTRGPMATPAMCNGVIVPIVNVDQIYSFERDILIKSLPKRKGISDDQFKITGRSLFNHILQIADNAGATDEHRALNYLAVRYDEIYHRTQLMQNENYALSAIEVTPSRLSSTRKIVDVIFSYENRSNRASQKWFVRVDVTEEFPFLVSALQQYFER